MERANPETSKTVLKTKIWNNILKTVTIFLAEKSEIGVIC